MPLHLRWIRACFVLGVGAIASGCGSSASKPVAVAGQVRVAGKPAAGVLVSFVPTSGGPGGSVAHTDRDGRFAIGSEAAGTGLAAGEYRLAFSQKVAADGSAADFEKPTDEKKGAASAEEKLPEKYTKPDTSPVSASVSPGTSSFDFDLPAR